MHSGGHSMNIFSFRFGLYLSFALSLQPQISINQQRMKVLITGASGFIGSFIVEESLRRGMETWAAIRPNSSKEFLSDERIRFIELDLSNEETLKKQLANNTFDYVIHAAGATKCINKDDFFKVNTEGTKNLVNALIALFSLMHLDIK